jgi:adenosylcobyric acid synthase
MSFSSSSGTSGRRPRDDGICKSLAVLGTMSDAGKSTIAAGICRVLANHGRIVAPFKAQNMSNNATPALLPDTTRRLENNLYRSFEQAVGKVPNPSWTPGAMKEKEHEQGYGEIGSAQGLQAEACKQVPRVEMNPLLLKSGGRNQVTGEFLCSVVVLGRQIACETYGELGRRTTSLKSMILESHQALQEVTKAESIIIEGAGSCTELNLMERDIVNLPLVRELECPWLLVANIECGGVFAQIIGTKMCVSERDWSLCCGM